VNVWELLLDVVILLGVGALLGAVFERLRQSAIIGYLLAGTLLGPSAFHIVESSEEVLAVSELGVALLLFSVGLEFSWSRLRGMGRLAVGSGSVQVVVTTALGTGIGFVAGLGTGGAIAFGAICALSSTASVIRFLTARGEIESAHGDRALGILLVQDMAVVPLVLVVSVLSEGGTTQEILMGVLRTAGIGVALVVGLYLTFNHLVPRLLSTGAMHTNRELPLLVAVVSGLGSALVAHSAGVSPALGAFVAGMLLAESPFATQVRADVSSLKTLLMTLFFTAIGMLTDPVWIASNALLVGSVVVSILVVKTLIVWGSLRLYGARSNVALAAGLCLGQLGEFSFVLADIARGGLFDEEFFMLIVSVTVLTMALTPYLANNAPKLAARFGRSGKEGLLDSDNSSEESGLVIVVGFGPAGRAAAERIASQGARVVVVDQNSAAMIDALGFGYRAVAGDARHPEVLEHAGLRGAEFLVVTVPGANETHRIVNYVRQAAPGIQILVRARFHRSLPDLEAAGAHVIVDEEQEVGRLIADAYSRMAAGNPDANTEPEVAVQQSPDTAL
jgi:CPA2 family monovalent cation:H+ antiporter-2